MRIAYLSPAGQPGGAEICLLDMISALRDSRPDWAIHLVTGEDGPVVKRATALGATVRVLPFPKEIAALGDSAATSKLGLVRDVLRATGPIRHYRDQLKSALEEIGADVVHSNGLKMHALGAMANPQHGRLLWHVHDYVSRRPLTALLLRHYSSRPKVIIANSQSVAEDLRLSFGPKRKIVPILNVVDLNEFSPEGVRLDLDGLSGMPSAPSGTVRVGLLATMAWWKGHRLFMDALALIQTALPVRVYIIGDSIYQTSSRQESIKALRDYAVRVGVADRVGFTGYVSQPAAAIRSLDAVVHTSTEPEPFGRVIVEAIACGKPVVSSGVGGAGEILLMGDFALAFKLNDPATLAKAITKIVADSGLRSLLGRNGLKIARERFGRERLARELPAIYEGL